MRWHHRPNTQPTAENAKQLLDPQVVLVWFMNEEAPKGFASSVYRAARALLACLALAAIFFAGLWCIWRAYTYLMPRALPFLPQWLTVPEFGSFLIAWLLGNVALVVILWRK